MKPSTIKIQEWHMPRITTADMIGFRRGYNAFCKRRGLSVDNMRDEVIAECNAAKSEKQKKGNP